ncbi:GntR family transcriptional regulator [Rhizomonospora bruguierae]|uniref:GntR family transcriptional regulator n=1 Tax=Rhizomonospora bruguierae TaxID=1581705 RepID=UPI001BD03016|nr:GntR family transcriptional regulator [Micromonospora sp. NBRC 107566]
MNRPPGADLARDNPMPLYYQIANVLRSRIDTGEWVVGDRLPSEAQLAASFKVSVVTMRQALSLLEQQGRLSRQQGKGTFVTATEEPTDRVRITVPLELVSEAVAGLDVRALGVTEVVPPTDIRTTLGLEPGEPCVQVRRVRSGTRGPITFATSYLPRWLGEGLTMADLQQSMMIDILEKRGVHFHGAIQTIEAALAEPDTAAVLSVPVGAPILLVRRIYELEDGRVGYVALNRHPSHEIRYELRLSRGEADGGRWALPDPRGEPRQDTGTG